MISELSKNDFYKCSSLINERGQLEVKAVIAGVNPGRIFVDNISSLIRGLFG
ncbi:putative DNA-binding ribbon-helix-helix protein [Bacillus sp. TE9106W]|nr:acetyltransferase, GNAT family protein [Bacillus cereus SJ1]